MIRKVGDVDIVMLVHGYAVRIAESGLARGSAVAAVAGDAIACHGGDLTAPGIHSADEMILHLHNQHVALRVEANFIWLVKHRFRSCPTVTRIAAATIPRNRYQPPGFAVET